MGRVAAGVVLLAVVAVAGAVPAARADGGSSAQISGVVFNERGEPVPDAAVEVEGGPSAEADARGFFRLVVVPGTVRITVRGPGGAAVRLDPVPVDAGESAELLITLGPDGARVEEEAAPRAASTDAAAAVRVAAGRVAGRVVHAETGKPVARVRVFVRGTSDEAVTDADGRFDVAAPAGAAEVSFIHPDFGTVTKPVDVPAAGAAALDAELTPVSVELDALVVRAPRIEGGTVALLAERRDAAEVRDVLGNEQMQKSGDGDAAAALRRVTSVTVVGGKYVYVRGMGDRYSSTLLNEFVLPSPEPERRTIPLDMFPTGILDNIVIHKSYNADLPAEFGGGAVSLFTRGFPDRFLANVSLSAGVVVGSTFSRAPTWKGGGTDFLGIDDGTRALPASVAAASRRGPLLEGNRFSDRGYTPEQLQTFGRALPNHWSARNGWVSPDANLAFSVGKSWQINAVRFGFLTSAMYDLGRLALRRRSRTLFAGAGNKLETNVDYKMDELGTTVTLGGLLTLGADIGDNHKIRAVTLVNRVTDDETRRYEGFNRDFGSDIRVTRLRWIERMLLTQQVFGEHRLPAARETHLRWRYAYALASRLEPDRREVRYDYFQTIDAWLLSDRPEGNQIWYADLRDDAHDAGADADTRFGIWKGMEGKIKFGARVTTRDRTSDMRRYTFLRRGADARNPDVLRLTPEQIFVPERIRPDAFQLSEVTRPTDFYVGRQRIYAAFAETELPITDSLRLSAGVRFEYGSQRVRTFELFNPAGSATNAVVENPDVLPALNLTWAFYQDMQLRLAASRIVSRPEARELSPAGYTDVVGGRAVYGNPKLKRGTITNADLRWEWYPSTEESVSVAAFFKYFEDPIETIVLAGAEQATTFTNIPTAYNMGVEVEVRKNFGFAHPRLSDLFLIGNTSLIWSRVDLPADGIQTSRRRPLQGQSPWVVNLQLLYDNPDIGTSAGVLYNVAGARIAQVGANAAPDIFEYPFHQLDVTVQQNLGGGVRLTLRARNLLDWPIRWLQGGAWNENYRRGREFSVGVRASF